MKYTIPLRKKVHAGPRYKRAKRAVATVRTYLRKHLKGDDVRLGKNLNQILWSRGARNAPPRVQIEAEKGDDGVIRAELAGHKYDEPTLEEREAGKEEQLQKLADKAGVKKAAPKASEEKKSSDEKPKKDSDKKEQPEKSASDKKEDKKSSAKGSSGKSAEEKPKESEKSSEKKETKE